MTRKLWYAVNAKGQGRLFTTLPERNESFKIWVGESIGVISSVFMIFESEGLEVPDLKWKDDPVELELSLKFK